MPVCPVCREVLDEEGFCHVFLRQYQLEENDLIEQPLERIEA